MSKISTWKSYENSIQRHYQFGRRLLRLEIAQCILYLRENLLKKEKTAKEVEKEKRKYEEGSVSTKGRFAQHRPVSVEHKA